VFSNRLWRVGLVALLLTSCCVGCGRLVRHGWILRGDWSLEMNRVPWLTGRSESHQEVSEEGACFSTGCVDVEAGPAMTPTEAPPFEGASCSRCGARGLCSHRGASDAGKSASVEGSDGLSRFHPVPTRPVFEPRWDPLTIPADSSWTEPPQIEPEPTQRAPLPRPVEVVPVPQPEDRAASRTKNTQPGRTSWVFCRPVAPDPTQTALVQRRAGAYASTTR